MVQTSFSGNGREETQVKPCETKAAQERWFRACSNERVAGDDCLFACAFKTNVPFVFLTFQKIPGFIYLVSCIHVIQNSKDKGNCLCPPLQR